MRCAALLAAIVLGTAALVGPAAARAGDPRAAERDLLQRLFSPCCYRETLDVHVSPIAEEVRMDIRARLARGEPPDAIVAGMVARFGEAVLAKPPRTATALGLFAGTGLLVTVVLGLALRRTRRVAAAALPLAEPVVSEDHRRHLEGRLQDELEALD